MFAELVVNLLASMVLVTGGYVWGKYRERQAQEGRQLEEFDFYPFGVDEAKVLYFDEGKFLKAVDHFLKHRNITAVRQLILIGQQNDVGNILSADGKRRYLKLYNRYGGDKLRDDTNRFLANYRRIVRLVGDSFPGTGIEIILHDLTNPAAALSCIKNNVTGRTIGSPATNLVFDLKTRRELFELRWMWPRNRFNAGPYFMIRMAMLITIRSQLSSSRCAAPTRMRPCIGWPK